MALIPVQIRLYAALNDVLPRWSRGQDNQTFVNASDTVGAAIEALGVSQTDVHLILVNGEPSKLDQRLRAGDRVSVYPAFESFEFQMLPGGTSSDLLGG